jgi:hypothetical protein
MGIVLTLTTIPERLNSKYNFDMRYCIESLLNQNYDGEYEVHLNIPNVYSKTGDEYIIPDWLEDIDDNKLKVFRTDDYGSITKLLPTIKRITDKDTIIIVVDDDMYYHEEMINEHIKNREKWPDYVVGYDGMRSRDENGALSNHFGDTRDYYYSSLKRDSLVDILQHYKTISYRRHFFGDDFFDFINEYGTWCDDTTVSAYFAKNKRPRLVTYFEGDKDFNGYDDWLENLRHTFPIKKYIEHGSFEGCNVARKNNTDDEKTKKLYTFIDVSYSDGGWKI